MIGHNEGEQRMVKTIRYGGKTLICHKIKGTKNSLRCAPKHKKHAKVRHTKKHGGRKHYQGHTKRGFKQDKKRKSKEPWEKAYRRNKHK
jgi:hypothetical protein